MRIEHNETAWLAWHIEALARQKKLPKLKELLIDGAERKPKRRQTVEEQIAIAHQWTAALTRK